jgi:DNA-binding NarL/FixJ family response regulator
MESAPPLPALALVRDLMFSSKITGTARALGTDAQVIRDPAQLTTQQARILLVDLNLPGSIEAAAAWHAANPSTPVVGFVSHVDTPTIEKARAAGLEVMARSGFVESLPRLLTP